MKAVLPAGGRKVGSAFTLLELLVAITISAALAGLLLLVSMNALNVWNRSNGRWATAAIASAALDQIEADLTSAVFRSSGGAELAVGVLTTTGNSGIWVNPPNFSKPTDGQSLSLQENDIALCRFGVAGTWLRFFVGSSMTTADRASVRAVGYQIVRRAQTTSSGAEASFLLHRAIVTDANTMKEGYDITQGLYATASGTEGAAGNLIRPNINQVIADNVVDFGVRFYTSQGGRLVPLYPASGGTWSNSISPYFVRVNPGAASATPVPDVVEVMIRVLTEEGVQQLRLYENPPSGFVSNQTWWQLVERYSHVYVRRIPIVSRGP